MTRGQYLAYNLIYNAAVFVYDGKYVVVRAGLRPIPRASMCASLSSAVMESAPIACLRRDYMSLGGI